MTSVIVPVYNVEPYLRECIDSVLSQTYRDFELILVDDGSPDNCGAICDEYAAKDDRIRVIHQEQSGVSVARNAGLDAARGEYIAFVDSDDWIFPNYLSYLMRAIEENQADISVVGFQRFADEPPSADSIAYSVKNIKTGIESCFMLYTDEGVVYTIPCGKIYRAALFTDIRYPIGRIHEDEATTYKLLYKARKVVALDATLYCYRVNPESIMGVKFSLKRYQAIDAFMERIAFFKEHGECELAELAEKSLPVSLAKMYINAVYAGVEKDVPVQYKMSVSRALRIIRQNSPDENYTYYLSLVHPNWLRPHAYLRKIKKILHIPCK